VRLLQELAALGPRTWPVEKICQASASGTEPGHASQILAGLAGAGLCTAAAARDDSWLCDHAFTHLDTLYARARFFLILLHLRGASDDLRWRPNGDTLHRVPSVASNTKAGFFHLFNTAALMPSWTAHRSSIGDLKELRGHPTTESLSAERGRVHPRSLICQPYARETANNLNSGKEAANNLNSGKDVRRLARITERIARHGNGRQSRSMPGLPAR
jgi:hypothetical protein